MPVWLIPILRSKWLTGKTCFPAHDLRNLRWRYAETQSQILGCDHPSQRPDFQHHLVRDTYSHRAVLEAILLIFLGRSPTQMAWIAASPHTTPMGDLMPWRWPGAMNRLANVNMGQFVGPSDADAPVPIARFAKRPKMTGISFAKYGFFKEEAGGPTRVSPSKGVAVTIPPMPVSAAKPILGKRLAAIGHRAYQIFSHSVLPHVRGQGRALLQAAFPARFLSGYTARSQGTVPC